MAILRPLCGLRYNTKKVPISDVIAPPYDVISEVEQDELYHRNAYNVVRLILGKLYPSDDESHNRYTRARQFFEEWIRKEVLIKDDLPSFYLYEQSFLDPVSRKRKVRRALFALLQLENFGRGIVFPHERTYSKPKADRLHLLNSTHANLSPVFGLYADNKKKVKKILSSHFSKPPLFQARDGEGVTHRFWKVSGTEDIQKIILAFQAKKIVLADGHHRYETALNHLAQREKELSKNSGLAKNTVLPCKFVLISLVDSKDPGLIVLPTHRLLKKPKGFSADVFLEKLSHYFDLVKVRRETLPLHLNRLSKLQKGFGISLGRGQSYFAKLKSLGTIKMTRPRGKSSVWAKLEVSILSYLIFEKILGLREEQFQDALAYTRSEKEAFAKVDKSEFAVAFLLRSIPVSQIQSVCERNDLLPHKSTYFYPKLASGLVFYQHN